MIYNEKNIDLFKTDSKFVLAHCVSVDCKMGAGIASSFRSRFPEMPDFCLLEKPKVGEAVLYEGERKVFNLFTKKYFHHKPTYYDLTMALESMKSQSLAMGIKNIAMPKIGSGLDRLNWLKVAPIIISTFRDTDIEILVCVL